MNEQQIRDIVQSELKKYDERNQFGLSPIPSHAHNGVDSQQISFTDLVNSVSYIAFQQITLTSAQILSLFTTPIIIVPTLGFNSSNVGVNYVYIVEGITARLLYGGTAYTGANNLEFRYTNASGAKVTSDLANTFINSTVNTFAHAPAVTAAFTPVYNSPIVVCVPTANPATGNSRITFTVKYRVVFL